MIWKTLRDEKLDYKRWCYEHELVEQALQEIN